MNNEAKTKTVLDRLLATAIRPNANLLAPIISKGDVAVVVFEPGEQAKEILRTVYGWNGEVVFRMSTKQRKNLGNTLRDPFGDYAAGDWLLSKRPGRIFCFVQGGTLCINFNPEKGYSLEPGTTNSERAASFH